MGKNVYFVSDALGFLLYCDRKQVDFKKFVTKGGNLIHSLLTQSLSLRRNSMFQTILIQVPKDAGPFFKLGISYRGEKNS